MKRTNRALLILTTVLVAGHSSAAWLGEIGACFPQGRMQALPGRWRDLSQYPDSTIAVKGLAWLEPEFLTPPSNLLFNSPVAHIGFRTLVYGFEPAITHNTGLMVPKVSAQVFSPAPIGLSAPLAEKPIRTIGASENAAIADSNKLQIVPPSEVLKAIEDSRNNAKPAKNLPAISPTIGGLTSSGFSPIKINPDRKVKVATTGIPAATGDLDQRLCSIVGVGLALGDALGMLSDSTGANVMLISPVETKLTVRLVNVRLVEALEHICVLSGLGKLRMNNTYILGTPTNLEAGYPKEWAKLHPKAAPVTSKVTPPLIDPIETPEPTISRTVALSNVDAASLAVSIKGVLGDKITAVAGPGSLMPSLADRETGTTTGVAQGVVQSDGRAISKTLILRGLESLVEEALRLVTELDTPRAQVAISVTISDVTDAGLKELGLNWTLGGFTIGESNPNGVNFGTFTRTGTSFAAAIKGLESIDKAKLLASPSVSVMDGQRAFVLIGSRLKFPEVVGYSTNGNPIITTKEERVGVYLQVAPEVAADGTITLSLYPQVSTVVGFTEIGGGSYPQIDSREAQTTLRVKSGDTVVIGGLYKNEEIEKIQQVPLLSKIPILGELFKSRKRTKAASQVIISLSMKLVTPEKK